MKIMHIKGKRRSVTICRDIDQCINNEDPIEEILNFRKAWMDRNGRNIKRNPRKQNEEEEIAKVYNFT